MQKKKHSQQIYDPKTANETYFCFEIIYSFRFHSKESLCLIFNQIFLLIVEVWLSVQQQNDTLKARGLTTIEYQT